MDQRHLNRFHHGVHHEYVSVSKFNKHIATHELGHKRLRVELEELKTVRGFSDFSNVGELRGFSGFSHLKDTQTRQSGQAFSTSPSPSFFKNLLTQQTAPSHTPDAGGDDVTYISQQFTTNFPTLYNVDPTKVRRVMIIIRYA
ncbi:hypothetical protein Tco_0000612 [Tanacetum coccineum]